MKVIYTAEQVDGRGPEHPRIAKEKLVAVIEECLIQHQLVKSYTLVGSGEFNFPFKQPNPLTMNGFFGKNPDYNLVALEVKELYRHPNQEEADFKAKLIGDIEAATDQNILEMVEKFHHTHEGTKTRYDQALAKVRELWKPYEQMRSSIESKEFSGERSDLLRALAIVNDCHVQGLLENLQQTQDLLKAGEKGKVKEKILFLYHDWSKKNLAPLYNACGDASFYGQGFWLARLIPSPEPKAYHEPHEAKTAEECLTARKKPFQVVQIL